MSLQAWGPQGLPALRQEPSPTKGMFLPGGPSLPHGALAWLTAPHSAQTPLPSRDRLPGPHAALGSSLAFLSGPQPSGPHGLTM